MSSLRTECAYGMKRSTAALALPVVTQVPLWIVRSQWGVISSSSCENLLEQRARKAPLFILSVPPQRFVLFCLLPASENISSAAQCQNACNQQFGVWMDIHISCAHQSVDYAILKAPLNFAAWLVKPEALRGRDTESERERGQKPQ